jgi:hypothetical protein
MSFPAVRLVRLACASLVIAATAARAEERTSPLPEHLPLGQEACFGRVYDAAHLASHPRQQVTSFHLAHEFAADPNSEFPPAAMDEIRKADGDNGHVSVTAYVRFRDRPGVYSNGLSCYRTEEGRTLCGVDCDGGSFSLKTSGASLLLENEGFVVVGGCGANEEESEERVSVSPGADDRVFRLDPKPVAACRAERDAQAPSWAKRGAAIRERLAQKEEICFARSYDAAHLASHPQQSVRRIAVIKAQGDFVEPSDWPHYDLIFRIETRDGSKVEKKASCEPDHYAYTCTFGNSMETYGEAYLARADRDAIALRDRRGNLGKLFGLKLGSDDRLFRLTASPASNCRF